jgi:hypothetical protein
MQTFDQEWIGSFRDVVNIDPALKVIGRHSDVTFMMQFGERSYTMRFAGGELRSAIPSEELLFDANWSFAIRAPEESWLKNIQKVPPPEFTDVIFMAFNDHLVLEGDLLPFWQNVRALLWMFDLLRKIK